MTRNGLLRKKGVISFRFLTVKNAFLIGQFEALRTDLAGHRFRNIFGQNGYSTIEHIACQVNHIVDSILSCGIYCGRGKDKNDCLGLPGASDASMNGSRAIRNISLVFVQRVNRPIGTNHARMHIANRLAIDRLRHACYDLSAQRLWVSSLLSCYLVLKPVSMVDYRRSANYELQIMVKVAAFLGIRTLKRRRKGELICELPKMQNRNE